MASFLKIACILALAGMAFRLPGKDIRAELTVPEWVRVINCIEYRKQILMHSSDPSYLTTPEIDTLAFIQARISTQVSQGIRDTTHQK